MKGHRISGSKKTGLEKRILYTEKQKQEQLEKLKTKKTIKPGKNNNNLATSPQFNNENGKEFQKQFEEDVKNFNGDYEKSSSLSSELAKAD